MLLHTKNLSLTLITENGPFAALKDINISIQQNECTAVVGESGSGKTLTALAVMGLLPKQAVQSISGQIIFNSKTRGQVDLLSLKEKQWQEIRGREIAMIFQEPMTALNPVYTCGKQLLENIKAHRSISSGQAKEEAAQLLAEVKLLETERIMASYPHEISGGQRQRVMIAMALAQNPSLLIADEPTTALDVTVQAAIIDLLKELQQKRGLGILFISHDLGLVRKIAQQVAVMYKGNVMESAPAEQIFSQPQNIYTKALLQCSPKSHPEAEILPTLKDFFEETPGGLKEKTYTPAAVSAEKKIPSAEPVISIQNLSVTYYNNTKGLLWAKKSGKHALHNITLDIYKGETLAVVGESGSGKSTLGHTLLQTTSITGGTVLYEGQPINLSTKSARKAFRQKLQLVFQDPYSSLNPRLTVGSQIAEAVQNFESLNDKRAYAKTLELLHMVGLDEKAYSKYPHEFSGGQRQRICIARALAPNPQFMVLDEAVSALDVSVQAQVLNLLKKLQKEFNLTYFFITHDLNVARFIADRILVIQNGRVMELQEKDELFQNPQSPYTRQLLGAME